MLCSANSRFKKLACAFENSCCVLLATNSSSGLALPVTLLNKLRAIDVAGDTVHILHVCVCGINIHFDRARIGKLHTS